LPVGIRPVALLATLTAALLLLAGLLRLPALLLSTLAALTALVLLSALILLAALILIAHVRPSLLVVVLRKGQRAAARLRSARARASLFHRLRRS
jgi:hypothetical protein